MPREDLIQYRRDTAANWATANPVLEDGEVGFDQTNNQMRVGDGVTAWADIPPTAPTPAELSATFVSLREDPDAVEAFAAGLPSGTPFTVIQQNPFDIFQGVAD